MTDDQATYSALPHTYGRDCLRCGRGERGVRCEAYSGRWVRFVRLPLHREAYEAAYLDQSGSSRNELQRLRREYETLPPRHAGWCPGECPAERCSFTQYECGKRRHFHSPCLECKRLRANVQYRDIGVEIGRSTPVEAPMPNVLQLDLQRALHVLGTRESAHTIAVWLSDGAA